ncbi:MAG: hypothetical protein HOL80_02075 [Candidatus Magasanikbacteria bacterium]|jgi:hypothetical protein|nr:hypothetical protein [Candidatus Magasanikbacteria bacterium]MBT5262665.1 hypothetical protein [Candidatus Magasanikbacteria bacterium]MBT5820488.1 hypothetical protein [Candidatus Magasanikbacteria bacterium]MBT6294086.1 hypothetical protein [Candidatus Magasanikbacteria bacterium]
MKHIILAVTIPLLFFGLLYSGSASADYAQNIGKNLEATKKEARYEAVATDPRIVVMKIISASTAFIGTAFLVYLVYAGYLIVVAQGEEQQIGDAKKIIIRCTIGIALMLSAYGLTKLIINVLDQDAPLQETGLHIQPTRRTGGGLMQMGGRE